MKIKIAVFIMVFALLGLSQAHGAYNCVDPAGKNVIVEGTVVNVKAFGTTGTGKADDSKSIQAAVNCLHDVLNAHESHSGTLFIPAGNYRMDKIAMLSQQKTDTAWQGIRVLGEGAQSTRLIGNNTDGIIVFNVIRRDTLFEVREIGFIAAIEGAGTGFGINMPVGGNRHNRSLIMRDIELSGSSPTSTTYFTDGIKTSGLWRPLLDNVFMTGPFGPKALPATHSSSCFTLEEAYSPTVINSSCWNARTGLLLTSASDAGPEGIMVTLSKFVDVEVGIRIENKGKEPEGMINNNHINARRYGIQIEGKKLVTINNNLFYSEASSDYFQDIYLKRVEKVLIKDNIFHFPETTFSGNNQTAAIRIENDSQDVTISENMFNSPGTAISISEGAQGTRILHNRIFKKNRNTRLPLNKAEINDKGVNTYINMLPAETTE